MINSFIKYYHKRFGFSGPYNKEVPKVTLKKIRKFSNAKILAGILAGVWAKVPAKVYWPRAGT